MATWQRMAIFAVKLVHSLIFLSVSASVLHIFWAGITGHVSRRTTVALSLASAEGLVFAANRFRCPLRTLAEDLGAESGQVTDIFLPRWFADRIPWIFTPLLVIGIIGLVGNRRDQLQRSRQLRGAPPARRPSLGARSAWLRSTCAHDRDTGNEEYR